MEQGIRDVVVRVRVEADHRVLGGLQRQVVPVHLFAAHP